MTSALAPKGNKGNGGLALLEASRAFEDAQYGIKGVLNNIPQMVMLAGATGGVAAAISAIAVAATIAYPKIKELYGAIETEALKKASEAFKDVFAEGIKAADGIQKQLNLTRTITSLAAAQTAATNERVSSHDAVLGGLEKEIALRKMSHTLAEEIVAAQGKSAGSFGAGADARQRSIAAMKDELRLRNDLLSRSENEGLRLAEAGPNRASELEAKIAATQKELDQLRRNKAGSDAGLAASVAAQGTFEKGSNDERNERKNQTAIKKSNEAIAEQLKLKEALLQALTDESKTSTEGFDKEMQQVAERNQKTYDEIKALEKLVAQKEKLNLIESHNENSEQQKTRREEAEAALQKISDSLMNTMPNPQNLLSSRGSVGLSASESQNALGVINLQRKANGLLMEIARNTRTRLASSYQ